VRVCGLYSLDIQQRHYNADTVHLLTSLVCLSTCVCTPDLTTSPATGVQLATYTHLHTSDWWDRFSRYRPSTVTVLHQVHCDVSGSDVREEWRHRMAPVSH